MLFSKQRILAIIPEYFSHQTMDHGWKVDLARLVLFHTVKNGGGNAVLVAYGKFTTREGGFRLPAFVHWPGRIAAGAKSAELTTTV